MTALEDALCGVGVGSCVYKPVAVMSLEDEELTGLSLSHTTAQLGLGSQPRRVRQMSVFMGEIQMIQSSALQHATISLYDRHAVKASILFIYSSRNTRETNKAP
ncbi:hypothetical protein EYF80_049559 [Liparis tanakae]|uniref:Uncharacterized protein n=1 Tax=Liparis tanakae TaxID=230148 RepID=A0A4Z2FJ15_9TELE|nr:hypothetical protein EYF80_049559 [Liparis tanakae]